MDKSSIYHFDEPKKLASITELGGKGYSLVRMSQSGLNVPPGFILSVRFFASWVEQVKEMEQWKDFLCASPDNMSQKAELLLPASQNLSFTEEQKQELDHALSRYQAVPYFAVRSSSPEEDLDGSSFAGGYETLLGLDRENIQGAILQVFCSCLHPRVFIYKQKQGVAIDEFKIAVVVQSQIESEIAGVGFSINPLNNDYDEAVFNSNWGLGESVVSGLASPDQITINKTNREIFDYQIGEKETSIWLTKKGGTEERPDFRQKDKTLTEAQAKNLMDLLCKVEQLYKKPMDIEWAFSNGNLYILQARPITTYIPLPPAMLTQPGENRSLYLDISLVVQALAEPISTLGHDFLRGLLKTFFNELFGTEKLVDAREGLATVEGGRLYINVSNAAHVFGSIPTFAGLFRNLDFLSGEILGEVDDSVYKTPKCPDPIGKIGPQAGLRNPSIPFVVLQGLLFPGKLAPRYEKKAKTYLQKLQKLNKEKLPEREYAKRIQIEAVQMLAHMAIPTTAFSRKAMGALKKSIAEEIRNGHSLQEDLERIDRSLPHNLTVEMGLSLFKISQMLDPHKTKTKEDFIKQFGAGQLSTEIQKAWKIFIDNFGSRGPAELDMASPRYRDRPEILLDQIFSMHSLEEGEESPLQRYDRCQKERQQAYENLLEHFKKQSWVQYRRFKHLYRILVTFGGYREHHKYFVIRAVDLFRERALKVGEQLIADGRLDNLNQVFDLTVDELDRSLKEPGMDLRSAIKQNTVFINQIKNRPNLPAVIDSRGRIFRPKRAPLGEGDLSGQPVSAGIVRGNVKVLSHPEEKPLLPGEILVARATDPGWTPLFVNAGAIILEIGGMLQHGALVAREYGKPCVSGVLNATDAFEDGEYIEVDGSTGIIRRNLTTNKNTT